MGVWVGGWVGWDEPYPFFVFWEYLNFANPKCRCQWHDVIGNRFRPDINAAGCDEHIREAVGYCAHGLVDCRRRLPVDMDTIHVLWPIDGAQQTLHLFRVCIHQNTADKMNGYNNIV